MSIKNGLFAFILILFVLLPVNAQTHTSVPLDDPVYYVLEQAQMRGLCAPLPSAKPYSRARVLSAVNEIIANDEVLRFGKLTGQERVILEQFRQTFSPNAAGLDMQRGVYSFEAPQNGINFSGELGVGLDSTFAGAISPNEGEMNPAFETMFYISFKGDLGTQASFGVTMGMGAVKNPRSVLGTYDTYYPGYVHPNEGTSFINREITVYSEPLAYFPYTYKKVWDGHIFYTNTLSASGQQAWPQELALGYFTQAELSGTFLNDHVSYRVARLDREWAGMTRNSSLVLSQSAEPFLGVEVTVSPFKWLTLSSLTGVLEYSNDIDPKASAEPVQNAFSVSVLELNYNNYFHFDIGSSVIWPKRFELGYLFPLTDNFIYQNNIGDFDNLALFFNIKGQYPGLGNLWFSFFMDEAQLAISNWSKLDRNMFAYQLGTSVHIPWLTFSCVTFSYTKNEPYNYTHTREFVPWYGDIPVETNYVNSGRSLGHYIPPNSDEILVRFETMPVQHSLVGLQYQLIRHGADYGSGAVDGSSLYSELDPGNRSNKKILNKSFLRDGAYQWMHILKIKGEYSLAASSNIPIKLFAEFGGVYSYFTNIDVTPDGGSYSYSIINTPEYPHSFRLIGVLGIQIFPK